MVVSYFLALLTAVANSTSSVLMRKAARTLPDHLQFRLGLVLRLLRHPAWLIGFAVSLVSYPLGAAALGTGQLAVVQPIMALELPLTLIGAAWAFGTKLPGRDWVGVAAMTIGLIGLLVFLVPEGGRTGGIPRVVWVVGSALNIAVIAGLYGLAHRSRLPAGRAAYLGAACGLAFGLSAAYTESMTGSFAAGGLAAVVTGWQLYGSVAAATLAMWLLQNAYAAGQLAASQPGTTLLDPAAAILWGLFVFQEDARGGIYLLLAIASSVAMAAGAVLLAQSPQLHQIHDAPGSGPAQESSM